MNVISHLRMGTMVSKEIKNQVSLKPYSFALGNMAGDLNPKLQRLSHYSDNCVNIIQTLINKLFNEPDLSLTKLSFKLGEIAHFVADFFCFAHDSQRYHESLTTHTIYELHLDKALKTHNFTTSELYLELNTDIKTLINNLINFRKQYVLAPVTIATDLNFIFVACQTFTQSLFLAYQEAFSLKLSYQ